MPGWLWLALALIPVSQARGACLREEPGRLVLHRALLYAPAPADLNLEVVLSAREDTGQGPLKSDTRADVFMLQKGRCTPLLRQAMADVDGARVQVVGLKGTPVMVLTGEERGVSDNGFKVWLYAVRAEAIQPLLSKPLEHNNEGGFHIGALGDNLGEGVVLWKGLGDNETHFSPESYAFDFYSWTGLALAAPRRTTTLHKEESVESAIKSMHYNFKDETDEDDIAYAPPDS